MKAIFFLSFTMLCFSQCKSSQQDLSQTKKNESLVIAKKEIGGIYQQSLNRSQSRLLALGEAINPMRNIPNESREYVVIDIASKEVLYFGIIEGGYVKWLDEDNIEAFSPPGMVRENQNTDDLIQVINVVTGKKETKTSYKKRAEKN